jgi:hypothetical protein
MKLRKVGTTRLLCFDLENRPLAYWYDGQTTSQITAFGWKWSDEKKPRTLLLQPEGWYVDDDGNEIGERLAHEAFRDLLCEAGVVYGHNIRRHDLPIMQAWLLRLELPPLPRLLTSDTCKDYPRRKDMSASLENLVSLYGIKGSKFSMSQPMWEQANKLTVDGVALARKRVASDVILQERLRDKLLELGLLGPPRMWGAS